MQEPPSMIIEEGGFSFRITVVESWGSAIWITSAGLVLTCNSLVVAAQAQCRAALKEAATSHALVEQVQETAEKARADAS